MPEGFRARFSEDWVSDITDVWRQCFGYLAGRPNLQYLEIGVYEGRSAIWFFENILTDPSSSMVGVDVFSLDNWEACIANLSRAKVKDRVTLRSGRSQTLLKTMQEESFDVIYVDGDHRARHVFQDIAFAWDLLKMDGVMILDDYLLFAGTHPIDTRPQAAIDAFVACFASEIQILHRCHRQTIVRKRPVVPHRYSATQVGSYVIEWGMPGERIEVANVETKESILLSEEQDAVIRRLLLGRRLSYQEPDPAEFTDSDLSLLRGVFEEETVQQLFNSATVDLERGLLPS